MCLLFLDVDSFKHINDTLGHAAGDTLLTVLADRFRDLLRPMDTVARFGGDEFTFLFEGLEQRARGDADRRAHQPRGEPVPMMLGDSRDLGRGLASASRW